MAENKTRQTAASVPAFLAAIPDGERLHDCRTLVKIMKAATGESPRMWGPSIVGFGQYNYKYESGRAGEWFIVGFSPRKQDLTLYIMSGFGGHDALMKKLGKYKTGKSCLYLKRLADVDLAVLTELIERGVRRVTVDKIRAKRG